MEIITNFLCRSQGFNILDSVGDGKMAHVYRLTDGPIYK